MEMMKRFVCVAVTLSAAANVCWAGDSLEDKLAKLDTASKSRQSTPTSDVKVASKEGSMVDILSGRVKTLAERLEEMDILQKDMQKADTTLDARLSELVRKFETSQVESDSRVQKVHDALNTGLAELELKLETSKAESDLRVQKIHDALSVGLAELESKFETSNAQSQSRAQKANDALYARLSELDEKVQGLLTQAEAAVSQEVAVSTADKAQDAPVVSEPAVGAAPEREAAVAQVSEPQEQIAVVQAQPAVDVAEPAEFRILGAPTVADPDEPGVWERDTLSNGFGGRADSLADSGIEVGLSWTNIYQANVEGGMSTHQRQGRHTGSYDLEIGLDLQQLWGIEGASMLVHTEGSWSRMDIDETSIGSVFGVNGDGAGRRAMDVTEVWYEQAMFDETLRFRFGKLDIGGGFECRGCPVSFDGSLYANDETAQFLNNALVNNPQIPMPDVGLGAVLYWNPIEWWYASIGAADAQADGRETGFRTAFGKEDFFFAAAETGVTPVLNNGKGPMPGAYRIGVWNDAQDKERFSDGVVEKDDVGFYISADQMVYKENEGEEDSQGLGVFTRYGMANKKVNDIVDFWSLGMQYQGIFEGRDDDVLGIGYAKGAFSTEAGYADAHESVFEIYYNAAVAPWLSLSPSVQFVDNPGGDNAVDDAVVVGLRAQGAF